MDEFKSIAELFAPLALPEGEALRDDAAFLAPRAGQEMVVTADAVMEGIHFLPGTPPDLVARKLLRVNLSDLAAKAAEPFGYLLTVAWPVGWDEPARTAFARGLAYDQAAFGIGLLGGDTISTSGLMTASVTALGYAPRAVRRSGARPGNLLMVSGAIGDGWLGLSAARGEVDLEPAHVEALQRRYALPEPRLGLRDLLREHATAALDVSDGLIGDLAHLAAASGVAIRLDLERAPVSAMGTAWLGAQADQAAAREALASGGDDYEIAFTVHPGRLEAVVAAGERSGTRLTPVGVVEPGGGVRTVFEGQERRPTRSGWRHG